MEAIGSLFRNSLFRAAGRRRRERQQQSQEPQQSNRTLMTSKNAPPFLPLRHDHLSGRNVTITRTNGKDRFIVDLKTRIMHRGEIFEIPTCGCGYWQSCFRLCRDIVKALVFSSNNQHSVKLGDLLVPTNIHPYHLVQLHPLWPQALTKANRADYCDLDQINRILQGGTAKASASGTTEPVATTCGACPDKFYTFGDNVPKTHKVCHTKLGEVFKNISDLAIIRETRLLSSTVMHVCCNVGKKLKT